MVAFDAWPPARLFMLFILWIYVRILPRCLNLISPMCADTYFTLSRLCVCVCVFAFARNRDVTRAATRGPDSRRLRALNKRVLCMHYTSGCVRPPVPVTWPSGERLRSQRAKTAVRQLLPHAGHASSGLRSQLAAVLSFSYWQRFCSRATVCAD